MILPATTLFPQAVLPLFIFEPRYRRMLADVLEGSRLFCVALRQPGSPLRERPVAVAGLGLVRASVRNPDGTSNLILQGLARVELGPAVRYRPYRVHRIRPLPVASEDSVAVEALVAKVHELVSERLHQGFKLSLPAMPEQLGSDKEQAAAVKSLRQFVQDLTALKAPDQLADLVSCTLLPNPLDRQTILETAPVEHRLRHLIHFLMAEIQRNRKDAGQ